MTSHNCNLRRRGAADADSIGLGKGDVKTQRGKVLINSPIIGRSAIPVRRRQAGAEDKDFIARSPRRSPPTARRDERRYGAPARFAGRFRCNLRDVPRHHASSVQLAVHRLRRRLDLPRNLRRDRKSARIVSTAHIAAECHMPEPRRHGSSECQLSPLAYCTPRHMQSTARLRVGRRGHQIGQIAAIFDAGFSQGCTASSG